MAGEGDDGGGKGVKGFTEKKRRVYMHGGTCGCVDERADFNCK